MGIDIINSGGCSYNLLRHFDIYGNISMSSNYICKVANISCRGTEGVRGHRYSRALQDKYF